MTDHWGNVERFVLTGTLLIVVALLTVITNEIATLADWSDQQATTMAAGINAVAFFVFYLTFKALLDVWHVPDGSGLRASYILAAIMFVVAGVAIGSDIDRLAAFGVAAMLVVEPAIAYLVPRLPQRWVDRMEAVSEKT